MAAFGFHVVVRPQNYLSVRQDQIDNLFRRINASGAIVSAYMPCGTEVVGFPYMLDYMGRKMRESQSSGPRGMKLIMLEHYTQLQFVPIAGLADLAGQADYNAARSYVIDALEQKKITVGEALRRWAITDEERNIRFNYVRPFFLPRDGRSIYDLNLDYVRNIILNVNERGYQINTAGVFAGADGAAEAYFPDRISLIPVLAAILAAVVLYAGLLLNLRARCQLLIWLAACVCAAAALLAGDATFVRQLLALAAAIVFPVLSINVMLDLWHGYAGQHQKLPQILAAAIWQLALAILLSLAGAALLSAILTDIRFLLEIDIYRGVKLTFVMPLLLLTLLYIKKYFVHAGESWQEAAGRIAHLLEKALTLRHLAVLGLLLFIAYYFVGRSGHTGGVPVPEIEIKMRLFLEQVLYARPREKEFMIGHPAFFLAVYAACRKAPGVWQYVLACAAIIGQGSLVETFCHMRTPVIMSLARAFSGYAAGAILGIAAVLVLAALLPRLAKIKKEIP